jgi:hypothetical protein
MFIFVIVQAMDGWLTSIGILRFGPAVEANPILGWYIGTVGSGVALFGAKLLAVGCALALYYQARHRTLAALTAIYLTLAIGPWIWTLTRIR